MGSADQSLSRELQLSPCHSDSDSDIECDVCEKIFPDAKTFRQHLSSKKHYKTQRRRQVALKFGDADVTSEGVAFCDTCKKPFSGLESYKMHMRGSGHAKNVRRMTLREKLKDAPEICSEEENGDEILQKQFAKCETCSKSFGGPESFQQHMQSEVHKKKVRIGKLLESKMADEEVGRCEICDKSFSGIVPYETHMHSAGHRREILRAQAAKEVEGICTRDEESGHFICMECQTPFTDPLALKAHLKGNSHEKMKAKSAILDFVTSHPEIAAGKSVHSAPSEEEEAESASYKSGWYFLVCKLCHTSFSGPESAMAHVKSKKHIKLKQDKADLKLLKEKMKMAKVENGVPPQNDEKKNNNDSNEDFEIL